MITHCKPLGDDLPCTLSLPYCTRRSRRPCPAGAYCPQGTGVATGIPCGPGQYSLLGAAVCTPCDPGYFGSSSGATNSTCDGPCPGGKYCPGGNTPITALLCPVGQYSLPAAAACTPCPSGVYGSAPGLATANCSGPCRVGFYGNNTSNIADVCDGMCPAGHYCPAGTVDPYMNPCPPGQYSFGGQSSCSLCPPGLYGATPARPTMSCSGNCRY